MLQIFTDLSAMEGDLLTVGGEEYNHIKNVLRMRPGEKLLVRGTDGGSRVCCFEIDSFAREQVLCRLVSEQESEVELPVRVLLFQGLPKADKMEFIAQKGVEMGVSGIIPVEMRRSIVKLAGDKRKKRVARWQAIVEAAAKQSRRAFVPEISDVMTMQQALDHAFSEADHVFVPYERMAEEPETETRALLENVQPGETVAVFVGPEGGFEESEVAAAVNRGAHTISLGRRILRTETAALAFLSFLIYRFEL
ncbi:MAG: RsmE family RNA methyltransferase [Eubacteriales bacterium]|nr:RsmE family RNA methyltransferase [Eubacteriales bacterium]